MDPYLNTFLVVLLFLVIGLFLWFVIQGFQIRRQAFSGTLTASQVVPPSGSSGGGLFSGSLEAGGPLNYNIMVDLPSTDTVTQVGIYQGPAGSTGPLLLSIIGPTTSPYRWTGLWNLSPVDTQNLQSGNLYLNVSTRIYPNGALRTQLLPS